MPTGSVQFAFGSRSPESRGSRVKGVTGPVSTDGVVLTRRDLLPTLLPPFLLNPWMEGPVKGPRDDPGPSDGEGRRGEE